MITSSLRIFGWFLCASFAWAFAESAHAEAPKLIPFQGYLTDDQDAPLQGAVSLRFNLYTTAEPTAPADAVYTETQTVTVDGGYFSVYLGESGALDLELFRLHDVLFVGVLVGDDAAELEPRIQLATAPYAAFAAYCGDASSLGGEPASSYALSSDVPTESDVDGWTANNGYALASQLPRESQVDTWVSNNGYALASGVPVESTVDEWVSDNGYALASQLPSETQVDTWVSNNGYLTSATDTGITAVSSAGSITRSISGRTATLNVNVDACPSGQSIRQINADGTVACETVPDSVAATYFRGGVALTAGAFTFITSGFTVTTPRDAVCMLTASGAFEDGTSSSDSYMWPALKVGSAAVREQGSLGLPMRQGGTATTSWTFIATAGTTYEIGCGIWNNSTATRGRCMTSVVCA